MLMVALVIAGLVWTCRVFAGSNVAYFGSCVSVNLEKMIDHLDQIPALPPLNLPHIDPDEA
jgi:hypothetical protein